MITDTASPTTHGPRRTALGSPCSSAWDAAHIALVEEVEASLGRRVCGARTLSGAPCSLEPNHENGRCRFHGGFNLTGAQPGNRNAVVHGLYARGIQTCGEQCPLWKTCPCAGPDVAKLPGPERPRCPYEVAAFNAAVTDARAGLAARAERDFGSAGALVGTDAHTACEVALLRVMVMRAASALAVKPMVDVTVVSGESYHMTTAKPGAYVQAFLRVSSEHRRYMKMHGLAVPAIPSDAAVAEQDRRARCDTSLLQEDLAQLDRHDPPGERRAAALLNEAESHAGRGEHTRAKQAFTRAEFLSPSFAAMARDPKSEMFLPAYERLFPMKRAANGPRADDG